MIAETSGEIVTDSGLRTVMPAFYVSLTGDVKNSV